MTLCDGPTRYTLVEVLGLELTGVCHTKGDVDGADGVSIVIDTQSMRYRAASAIWFGIWRVRSHPT